MSTSNCNEHNVDKAERYTANIARVKENGLELAFIDEQTESLCEVALNQNGMALAYVKNKTVNLCLIALVNNGMAIQYIDKPRLMFVTTALVQNGLAIRHIPRDTTYLKLLGMSPEDLTKMAVTQNGLALRDALVQTPEICDIAVNNNSAAYKFVDLHHKCDRLYSKIFKKIAEML